MLFIALVLLGGVRSEKVGRQGLNANNCQIVCSGAECTTQCDMPAEIVETLSPPVPEQFSPVTFSEAEQHELRIALISLLTQQGLPILQGLPIQLVVGPRNITLP